MEDLKTQRKYWKIVLITGDTPYMMSIESRMHEDSPRSPESCLMTMDILFSNLIPKRNMIRCWWEDHTRTIKTIYNPSCVTLPGGTSRVLFM